MIVSIFAMYDKKAECYLPPFFMQSVGLAHRGVFDELHREQSSKLWIHASDFALHVLGKFDDSTGEIESHPPMVAFEVVSVKQQVIESNYEVGNVAQFLPGTEGRDPAV